MHRKTDKCAILRLETKDERPGTYYRKTRPRATHTVDECLAWLGHEAFKWRFSLRFHLDFCIIPSIVRHITGISSKMKSANTMDVQTGDRTERRPGEGELHTKCQALEKFLATIDRIKISTEKQMWMQSALTLVHAQHTHSSHFIRANRQRVCPMRCAYLLLACT